MGSEKNRINVITCTEWVPKGASKQYPDKVEISKEELRRIIKETSDKVKVLEEEEKDAVDFDGKEIGDEEYTALEMDALQEDMQFSSPKNSGQSNVEVRGEDDAGGSNSKITKPGDNSEKSSEDNSSMEDDDMQEYGFETYDVEKGGIDALYDIGKLVVHADDDEDPFITNTEDDEDDRSEKENYKVLPTDNLIAVGHIEGDAASLEVYIYNSDEGSLYVHHDIFLPSIPICMEWLNYDPGKENSKPGNMIAIGNMSPSIDIWDLDVVDTLEPAYTLRGKTKSKKAKKSCGGHSDAVLSLAWNRNLEHILASSSADQTVILWDLEKGLEAQKMAFKGRIQDIKWHPDKKDHLLAGYADKRVRLLDCSSNSVSKSWKLDGEIEGLVWNPEDGKSCSFYASTNRGTVYLIDTRKDEHLQKIQAHTTTCTGMVLNAQCPGCLVTASEDATIRIWDLWNGKTKLVEESQPNVGIIHTVSCSPDSPFVLSIGGNKRDNNFKVWDIRDSRKVREAFFDRLGLPFEDEENVTENVFAAKRDLSSNESSQRKWKPPKRSKKRKGGHLDKRKY